MKTQLQRPSLSRVLGLTMVLVMLFGITFVTFAAEGSKHELRSFYDRLRQSDGMAKPSARYLVAQQGSIAESFTHDYAKRVEAMRLGGIILGTAWQCHLLFAVQRGMSIGRLQQAAMWGLTARVFPARFLGLLDRRLLGYMRLAMRGQGYATGRERAIGTRRRS